MLWSFDNDASIQTCSTYYKHYQYKHFNCSENIICVISSLLLFTSIPNRRKFNIESFSEAFLGIPILSSHPNLHQSFPTFSQIHIQLTYSIVEIEAVELAGGVYKILQAARRCQPIWNDCSRATKSSAIDSTGCWFESVERPRLTERTFKLMNRNVPNWTCRSISIRVDRDLELTFALSWVNGDVNWKRKLIFCFDFVVLCFLPCCPEFSPQIVMLPTVNRSPVHAWKPSPPLTAGPPIENVLKSNRIWQTWLLTALTRYVHMFGTWPFAGDTSPVCRITLTWPHWMLITGSSIKSQNEKFSLAAQNFRGREKFYR